MICMMWLSSLCSHLLAIRPFFSALRVCLLWWVCLVFRRLISHTTSFISSWDLTFQPCLTSSSFTTASLKPKGHLFLFLSHLKCKCYSMTVFSCYLRFGLVLTLELRSWLRSQRWKAETYHKSLTSAMSQKSTPLCTSPHPLPINNFLIVT